MVQSVIQCTVINVLDELAVCQYLSGKAYQQSIELMLCYLRDISIEDRSVEIIEAIEHLENGLVLGVSLLLEPLLQ